MARVLPVGKELAIGVALNRNVEKDQVAKCIEQVGKELLDESDVFRLVLAALEGQVENLEKGNECRH